MVVLLLLLLNDYAVLGKQTMQEQREAVERERERDKEEQAGVG